MMTIWRLVASALASSVPVLSAPVLPALGYSPALLDLVAVSLVVATALALAAVVVMVASSTSPHPGITQGGALRLGALGALIARPAQADPGAEGNARPRAPGGARTARS